VHPLRCWQVPERPKLIDVLELQRRRVPGRTGKDKLLELHCGHLLRGNRGVLRELRFWNLPELIEVLNMFELCGWHLCRRQRLNDLPALWQRHLLHWKSECVRELRHGDLPVSKRPGKLRKLLRREVPSEHGLVLVH